MIYLLCDFICFSSLSVCYVIQDVNTSVEGKMSMLFHIVLNVRYVYIFMECLLHSALTGPMEEVIKPSCDSKLMGWAL